MSNINEEESCYLSLFGDELEIRYSNSVEGVTIFE